MLQGKQILLIIAGGIAAYKSLLLIRRLQDQGASVRCVLTAGGAQFVTPLSVAALSGEKAYQELFSLTDEAEMGHIRLSREADLVVVAPATADLISKMARGSADDLASTVLLATDKPVLIAPAMNVEMWGHPATQRNITTLRGDGILIVGPAAGDLACGETGPGRMVEAEEIVAAIAGQFATGDSQAKLTGKRVLITAGPTHEPIDPVRYIANRSSGKQGYAIAAALAKLGADTVLVSGPTGLADPAGVSMIRIESAREMLQACKNALPADAVVCVAAVADWRTVDAPNQKLKKDGNLLPPLELTENPDILKTLANLTAKQRPELIVGFAAETEKIVEHAKAKLKRKCCDWIVANDVSHSGAANSTGVMGGDQNKVHIVSSEGVDSWPEMSKQDVADALAEKIADQLGRDDVSSEAAQ